MAALRAAAPAVPGGQGPPLRNALPSILMTHVTGTAILKFESYAQSFRGAVKRRARKPPAEGYGSGLACGGARNDTAHMIGFMESIY